jgi:outer membrane phospholipase A
MSTYSATHKRYYELHKKKRLSDMKAYRKARKKYFIEYNSRYYKEHKTELNTKGRVWRLKNLDKEKAANKAWYAIHKNNPARLEKRRTYRRANSELSAAATNRHRASKMKAFPTWANNFFISEAYHLARLRTKATGFKWQVDHIVPLQSKIVCGLHVENNLQVIPASENQSKCNRHWPNMP